MIFCCLVFGFSNLFADVLSEIKDCVGIPESEQRQVTCNLKAGRSGLIYLESSEMSGRLEDFCFQKALAKAKIFAASYTQGHKVSSDYSGHKNLGANVLSSATRHRLESELESQVRGFFEVFRTIKDEKCFVGVSQDFAELKLTSQGESHKHGMIIKGRSPFKDVVRSFSQIALKEGAAIVKLPGNGHLVVASGKAEGKLENHKAFRIAETRAQVNLGRLLHQEKVFQYSLSESLLHLESSRGRTETLVETKQVFASFTGFSKLLQKLQPVHCHWHDLKNPNQRWALVGFHVSEHGEIIEHNQPWGL